MRRLHPQARSAVTRAFTLIELLVVIVILGVLMAVALPTYLRQQQKAKDSNAKSQLTYAYRAIRSALPEFSDQYPSAASIVSAIAQSEPELTVASGGCNSSTDDKHVTVDPILTSSLKLALYTKSASGTWWRLSAGTSGAQTFTPLGTCTGPLSTGTLTVSGNEITDTTRDARTQGDGLAADSSYGVWESATNLVKNGGFEVNTSDWIPNGSASLARVTTTSEFGAAALQVTATAAGGNAGKLSNPAVTVGATYSYSAWLKAPVGQTVQLLLHWQDGSNATLSALQTSVTATGSWQRLTLSGVAPASSAAAALYVVAPAAAFTFWVDGVQFENNFTPSPYVDTNGAQATRAAAHVQAPSADLALAQGWVAIRFRPEWASTDQPYGPTPGYGPTLFRFGDSSAQEHVQLFYRDASYDWRFRISGSGLSTDVAIPASHSAGAVVTLIGYWKGIGGSGTTGLSLNGSTFSTAATTIVPAITTPEFEIGSYQSGSQADGEVLWFACGTGTLTDADAQTINSWGNNDPTTQDFPSAAQATLAWAADGSGYVTGN